MGKSVLKHLLISTEHLEADDELYVEHDAGMHLDTVVNILPCDPTRPAQIPGWRYILGVEQLRDTIEALETNLNKKATLRERLLAVKYFIDHDAFISPESLPGHDDDSKP